MADAIRDIFAQTISSSEGATLASLIKARQDAESDAQVAAQRLVDYYLRSRELVKDHIKTAALKTVESVDEWSFPVINAVPRTIRRLATTYSDPPSRRYVLDSGADAPDAVLANIELMLERVDLNRKMLEIDRYATLLNTVHVEAVMRKERIDYDIHLRPTVAVVADPEDYLAFEKLSYKLKVTDPDTLDEIDGWVYWTPELHAFISTTGVVTGLSLNNAGNPYADLEGEPMIPIVTVRKVESTDYWGEFGVDVVEAVEALNVELGIIWETMKLQAHGWPLITNFNVEAGATVVAGVRKPLIANKVSKDDVEPNVKFAAPEPKLDEVREFLNWFLSQTGGTYGMPPSSWAIDEKAISGFSKFMDNIELMEEREEAIPKFQAIEADLFEKSRLVWNTWQTGSTIPDGVTVLVEFPSPKVPESPTEEATRFSLEVASNLASIVDWYVEKYGLDRKEALERALLVADENRQVKEKAFMSLGLPPAFGSDEADEDKDDEEKDDDKEKDA